jgi:hypothetical protein
MSLRRTQIRKAIVRRLQSRLSANVYDSRIQPFDFDNELPAVNVITQNEEVEKLNEAPRSYRFNCFVQIEITTKSLEDAKAAEQADRISEQVIQAIADDDSLGFIPATAKKECLADDTFLIGMDQDMQENAEQPVCNQRLIFHCKYHVDLGRVFGTNFDSAKADWSINGDIDTIEATDQLELQS